MKNAIGFLAATMAAVGAFAGEYHWTGAGVADGVGAWTNPANWSENAVPGVYTNSSSEVVGSAGDIAIFPAVTTDQVIDFEGLASVKAIYVRGSGAGRYTFGVGGREPEQVMPLEKDGAFVVESTVTQVPVLGCGIGVGPHGSTICITNDIAGAELVISNIGYCTSSSWTSTTAVFAGRGGFRLTGTVKKLSRLSTTHDHGGTFYYDSAFGACGTLSINEGCGEIVITEGSVRKARMDGYSFGSLYASPGPVRITGGGTFQFCAGQTSGSNPTATWNNAPVNLGYNDTIISTSIIEGYDALPSAGHQVGIRTSSTSAKPGGWNTGTLVLASPDCRLCGEIEFYSSAALKIDSFGLKGEQSRVGWCTNFYLCNNARMIYTGAGETTDRNLHIGRTLYAKNTASGSCDLYTPGFSFEQSGTGKFIVASTLEVAEAELPTGASFKPILTLTGDSVADGEWSGELTLDNLSVTKQGSGRWILSSAANDIKGGIFVSNGTLRVDHPSTLQNATGIELAGGTLEFPANVVSAVALPAISVPANSTLKIGSGASVVLSSLSVAAGKTLTIDPEDDSVTVKFASGYTQGDLSGVTINGVQARVNDQGEITVLGTAWKTAGGGDWHVGANWSDGVPAALGDSRIWLGGNLEVAIDSAAVCSNLNVRNSSGATKVGIAAPLSVSRGASLMAAGNSTLEIKEGGSLSTAAAAAISFTDGAVLKVDGGSVNFADSASRPTFSSSIVSVTGGIRMVSGVLTNSPAASARQLATEAGATIEASGGEIVLRSHSWFADLTRLTGSMRHVFDGTSGVSYYNNATAAFRVDGILDFMGDSQLNLTRCNGGTFVLAPVTAGKTIDVNFTDRARLFAWNPDNSWRTTVVLGCPDATMSAGEMPVMRMNFDSDAEHRASGLWVGVERSGTAEVVMKRGSLNLYNTGLALGTYWESYWINASRNRGTFKMLGGVLVTGGHNYCDAKSRLCGICVGGGTYEGKGDASHPRYRNFRFRGRFELDGGVVTNTYGYVAVGVGRADGELIQRGGNMTIGTSWAAQNSLADGGHPALYAVGGLMGSGLWAVSNGTVEAKSALQPMYVGGVSAHTIGEYSWRLNLAPEDFFTSAPETANAATGCLEVVNGSFTSKGDLFVGGDGRGEVRLVGSQGQVRFRNLVMSNNVESVARFVLDANGVKPLDLTGSATITDGAKLVVDVSGFTGRRNNHPLITAAGGMTGTFPEVTLVGDNQAARLAMVEQNANGVRLVIQRGVTIILR